jgi:thioredoxin reductase (NADPH)
VSEVSGESYNKSMTENTNEIQDVTIVGGGPVGLFGAFYAGMRQMRTKIIDSLPELGGQLSALYPEKYIFDMPGFPKVLAKDLVKDMAEQGTRFGATVCLDEKVLNLKHEPDGTITLTTQRGEHRSRTVVLAMGAGAFAPIKLNAPGLTDFEDRGVRYFVKDKSQFEGKRLLIIGGGDSAVDWCMNLQDLAEHITLIHRRDVFKAHEESVDWLLNRSPVHVRLWHELKCVQGGDAVTHAVIFDNKTKEEFELSVDAVLLNLGFKADIGPVREWGIELEGNKIPINRFMQTNLSGVYAAGDIATYPGKLDLIATGVGEICTAVYHAKTIIDPTAKFKQVHSSNLAL